MVHLLRFPEIPNIFSWSASSQVLYLFLHHWVADGTYLLSFFVFLGMLPWAILIPTWPPAAYPEDPKFLGIPKYPSSAFSLSSPTIFSLKGWAKLNFSFSLFHKAQNLPVHGFRPLPTYFLVNLGLTLSLKAQMVLRFQFLYCFGLWYNIVIFWTWTQCFPPFFISNMNTKLSQQ